MEIQISVNETESAELAKAMAGAVASLALSQHAGTMGAFLGKVLVSMEKAKAPADSIAVVKKNQEYIVSKTPKAVVQKIDDAKK